jgi:lipoate-protein ligase B
MAKRLLNRSPLCFQPWPKNTTINTIVRGIATSQAQTVQVLSSLQPNSNNNNGDDCIDYCRGWAWQQILLSRRLQQRRQPIEATQEDRDHILLLEHKPVYTLGRGASEEHLTFLFNHMDPQSITIRAKLSRKYRGPDAARLSVDRRSLEDRLLQLPTLEEAVEVLASAATPVLAPNGVPIFRVDRGGEVTFHGPQQLVIYPMLDLKREPFQADLHWFLRQVEEVVIQTLQHYDIVGVRDEINTGR